jgi:glycosyltransferase involved in cell wall biosynthesis
VPQKPRVLYLCSSWPVAGGFGGQLRAFHLGRALAQVAELRVLMVGSDAANADGRNQAAANFELLPPVLPQLSANGSLGSKLRRACDTRYLDVHGFTASPADRARVEAAVAGHDAVWILNGRTPNILNRWHWPATHLDIDDVPSTYARALAERAPHWRARWKFRAQRCLLHRRERRLLERFTTLSTCSAEDRAYLGGDARVHVIPNGFARPASAPQRTLPAGEPRLGFIGLYDYPPNREGVAWFLRECWPALRAEIPGLRLRLIGKGTDGPLRPTDAGVEALGFVADSAAEIATWSAMIVPINAGGGTRIKIAEAFSRKCPVVSTRLGAFGYEGEDGEFLRLADRPADFVRACADLVRQPDRAAAMAERAWGDFLQRWSWDAIEPKVAAALGDCLGRARPRRG